IYSYFFFQAEDGIRDSSVTGVQTCALPISAPCGRYARDRQRTVIESITSTDPDATSSSSSASTSAPGQAASTSSRKLRRGESEEIGRASCRERVWCAASGGVCEETVNDT